MLKYIEKICIISEDEIELKLSDVRDNYIYPASLGELGSINIYEDGIFININSDEETKIVSKRESILKEAFKEVFGTHDYNPLSKEYYRTIKTMIKNKTITSLGYKIVKYEEEDAISYHRH